MEFHFVQACACTNLGDVFLRNARLWRVTKGSPGRTVRWPTRALLRAYGENSKWPRSCQARWLKGLLHAQCQPAKSRKRHNPGHDQRRVDQQGGGQQGSRRRQEGPARQDSDHGENQTHRTQGARAKTASKTRIARHRQRRRHPTRNCEARRGQTSNRKGAAQHGHLCQGQLTEALGKNANRCGTAQQGRSASIGARFERHCDPNRQACRENPLQACPRR